MSLSKLLARLADGIAPRQQNERNAQPPIRLATAAVLLEIGHSDGSFTPMETGELTSYLQRAFSLSPEETKELIDGAEEIRLKTIDHFALTNYIRKNASLQERVDVVKTMWRLVYSDGKLSEYENYLVRKLADLLGLEHHVMIDAKSAVLDERGR